MAHEEHLLEESLSTDFNDLLTVLLDCPTENNFYASMAAIQIPGPVFGLMIQYIYSMNFKPIDKLNVACFSLICASSNIH